MARHPYRRASEIGEFVYCHRAWWLHHIRGNKPGNQGALAAGRVAHDRHSANLRRVVLLRRLAVLIALVALALLAWEVWRWM